MKWSLCMLQHRPSVSTRLQKLTFCICFISLPVNEQHKHTVQIHSGCESIVNNSFYCSSPASTSFFLPPLPFSVTPHHPTITSPPLPASPPLPFPKPYLSPRLCAASPSFFLLLHSRLSQSGRTAGWRTGCGPPCAFLSFYPWDGLMLRQMTLTQGKVLPAELFCMYELSMCPL